MIYFLHGQPNKIFEKAGQIINSMLAKKPDASVFKINSENFNEDELKELIGGQALFNQKYIVTLSRLLEVPEAEDFLMNNLKELAESENVFVWVEEKVNSKTLEKISKKSEKVQNFEEKKVSQGSLKDSFNIFALADAVGEKNSKKAWLLYVEALKFFTPEEIYGTLWWQVKSMVIASKSKSAGDSGLKPFVYSKSKRYSEKFEEDKLQNLSDDMIDAYHLSRRSGSDLGLRLEKIILSL